jgi:hypothetical protein
MPLTARTTPCQIPDDLRALRKTVAARGQIETIQAIDALIGLADAEAVGNSIFSFSLSGKKVEWMRENLHVWPFARPCGRKEAPKLPDRWARLLGARLYLFRHRPR